MHDRTKRKSKSTLTAQQVHEFLSKLGKRTFETSKKLIYQENIENRKIHEALHYFGEEGWHDEEYAGFMALTCQAVGGEPTKTIHLGASLTLIRGAMDIHDDIIDEQPIKANKPTLFGKYGPHTSLLIGDLLYFKGLTQLYKTISQLPPKEGQAIANMVKHSLLEVGTAIASETDFRGNFDLPPENLMKILAQKSTFAGTYAKIGAVIGGANETEANALGRFGELFALLTMIRDEFIDIYEPEELQNRTEKECLPLPLLLAFKDKDVRNKILPILKKEKITAQDTEIITKVLAHSREIKYLKKRMQELKETALLNLKVIKDKNSALLLTKLLDPVCEDL